MSKLKISRYFLWAFSAAIFIWSFTNPLFRDAEGFLVGKVCLPISAGISLFILGLGVVGRFRGFSFWFALALIGQAVALQLIEAGSQIKYQHYLPLYRMLHGTNFWYLIFILVQTGLVFSCLLNRLSAIKKWLTQNFKPWQLLCVGLVFLFSGATVSRNINFYFFELLFAAFVQLVNLGNIVLMVWVLPEETLVFWRQKLHKWLGQSAETETAYSNSVDRFVILGAIWVTAVAVLLSVLIYERHPHIPDEVAYLYQARYLATGTLTMPAPPVQDAFDIYLMQFDGERWYPTPPLGWPAMLAVGVLLGVPWLANPALAGINILLAYLFLQEVFPRRTARLAVFLLCLSPWNIFMAMNFMTHTFTLTCALVAAVTIARATRSGKAIWGWAAGIATGMVSLIRPLEGLIVAGLLGLWSIGFGRKRLKISTIIGVVLGSIVVGSVVLPYNKYLTGDPFVFPIMAYTDEHFGPKSNAIGFGPQRGMGWPIDPFPGHSPIDALVNANLNTFSINVELFGWSTGSLILLALSLLSGSFRKADYLMIGVIAAVFIAHFFYYFSGGPDFGARYWYLMLVPLVAITVRGIQFLENKINTSVSASSLNGTRVMVAFLSLCFFTLINYFPWRAIDKYYHYRGMRPDIRYLATEYGFGRSLVLIQADEPLDYASAATYNPVDLGAEKPVYAWDRGPETRACLLAAYPDRPIWIVKGPSITGRGFEVAGGPLSAFQLVAQQSRMQGNIP